MRTLLRVWRQPRRSLKSAPGGSGAATPASVIRGGLEGCGNLFVLPLRCCSKMPGALTRRPIGINRACERPMSPTPVRGHCPLVDNRAHQGMSELDLETVIGDQSSYFGGVQIGKRYLTARTCSCQLIDGAGLRRGSDQESSLSPFAKGCHAALERGLNSRSRRKQFRQGLGSQQLSCGHQVWGFEDGERIALGCLPYSFCDSSGHGS